MAWLFLVVAGLLEVAWAFGLSYTDGFTKLVPSVLTGLGILLSMWLLGQATRTIPVGTAYGVWVGIGAAGTALVGLLRGTEAAAPGRVFFIALLVVAVVGLKATSD